MTRSTRIPFLGAAGVIPLVALTVAACGGGGGGSAATGAPAAPKTTSGAAATVGAGKTGLGNILVDSKGDTVYLFRADNGTKSTCYGACAVAWPPLLANKPTAGKGLSPSLIGMTTRTDGKSQVTYAGHPLYLYAGDQNPGQTTGQALNQFGALWYVLSPTGNQVTQQPSASAGGNSGGGGVY